MSLTSNWNYVDLFTVNQAAALWCEVDPTRHSMTFTSAPSEALAIKQMLTGAIIEGDLYANSENNRFSSVREYSDSIVSRTGPEEFAKSKNLFPAFLFDTIAPFVDPRDKIRNEVLARSVPAEPIRQKPNPGGRPPEYDWNSFTMEIIHVANSPDGLPETQAELIRKMQEWFLKEFGSEPAESSVKQRISKIYNYLDRGKN